MQKGAPSSPETPTAVEVPPELQGAVRDAEQWGRALYDAYVAPQGGNSPAIAMALETVSESVKDHCSASYRAVAVMPSSPMGDRLVVYDIGEIPDSQGLMLGRHYRVETTSDGKGVLLGEPSTTSCVTLPPAAAASDADPPIAHDLSPAPNEFHVFLSILHHRRMQIATTAGLWLVADGKISYLGRI